jgi:hypothetical protein
MSENRHDPPQMPSGLSASRVSTTHVDYVQAALDRRFTSRLTARVTSGEYQRRVLAMAFTYAVAGGSPNRVFVLSFRRLQSGDGELQQAQIDTSTVLPGLSHRPRIEKLVGVRCDRPMVRRSSLQFPRSTQLTRVWRLVRECAASRSRRVRMTGTTRRGPPSPVDFQHVYHVEYLQE